MDTNTTLAHLAAQMAEIRQQMVSAEHEALRWKGECEKMHETVHHLEDANHEYSVTLDRQR